MKTLQIILARILTFIFFPFFVMLIVFAAAIIGVLGLIAFIVLTTVMWLLIPFSSIKAKSALDEVEDVLKRAQIRVRS